METIIKTSCRFLTSTLAILGLMSAASCERAEFQEKPEYVTSIKVSVEQPDFSEFDTDTKASYSLDEKNRPVASWSEDDIIGIYPVGGDQVSFPLSGNIDGGSATFDGGSWSLKTEYQYAAYCPFNEDYYHRKESSLPVSYNGQRQTGDNNVDHLGAYAFMASAATSPAEDGSVAIALKSVGCIVQLKLKLPAGMPVSKLTLTDHTNDLLVGGEMDLTQENVTALKKPVYSKSISIACRNLTAGAEAIKVWMMLPPQDLRGHELELTATGDVATVSATMASCTKNLTANGALVLDFDDASSDYSTDYLSFAAEEPGSTISMQIFLEGRWTNELPSLEYSFDKDVWTPFEIGTTTVTLPKIGDRVYFRAARYNATFNQDSEHRVTFVMTGKIAAGGNIMTLLDKNGLHDLVPPLAFSHLFSSCESLVTAPELPARNLSSNCYEAMFLGCSGLAAAPELPATELETGCYMDMFWGCTSLESSPYLPAKELKGRCYDHMFYGCSNLKRIDVNFTEWNEKHGCTSDWVTNVAPSGSFICPTSLVAMVGNDYVPKGWSLHNGAFVPDYLCFTAEEANSTVGMNVAYSKRWKKPLLRYSTDGMSWEDFDIGTTTVTLKKVGDKVYFMASEDNGTFSLDDANYLAFEMTGRIAASGSIMTLLTPSGAGESVPEYAFYNLFSGCNALTSAPKLPATGLADYCYYQMFKGCSGLTSAPVLPATELAESCYGRMFMGCSDLASAPELPSTKLENYCYAAMFWNCTSLTSAPELQATELKSGCYDAMFAYCTKLNRIETSFTDWNEAGNSTDNWLDGVASTGTFVCQKGLEILYDGSHIPYGWTVNEVIPDFLCFTAEEANSTVGMTAPTGVGGWDIPVLQYSTDLETWQPFVMGTTTVSLANVGDKVYFRTTKENSGFYTDFGSTRFIMSGKIAASGNIMTLMDPLGRSKAVPPQAFRELFYDCSSLTSAPSLPAMELAEFCYYLMFYGCSNLTSAPDLPATELAQDCYANMFRGCTVLTSAPELLPATTLAKNCYSNMFYDCGNLTTAPELPATTLAEWCYGHMFYHCSSLTSAPELPATTLAEYCYSHMFLGCTALTSAPVLPATTLAYGCYQWMFYGCSKLNRIETSFTDWNARLGVIITDTEYWVKDVASTGTFVCPKNLPIEYGEDSIPSGWTVVTK